jgi:nucleotide-binding universal stress UspA family protein
VSAPVQAELRRILVPTDFTPTSEHALDWAVALAARVGASVTVMHAYEIPIIGFPDGTVLATPDVAIRIADASRAALEAAVERRRAQGIPLDSVLREGTAWEEINAMGEILNADLIVIGTHGRRGFSRALLGSVAENVVRTANRPVVTIRGDH